MQQSGPIPGLVGWFSGGQTIAIDTDTMTVVDQAPMQQQAYDASPLVETVPIEEPVQAEETLTQEVVEPQEILQEAPVQEPTPPPDAMPEVVGVPDLQETQINEGEIS